ncbi:MAG: glycosyltransferase, exosortase A system-associated [Alphaproteobacteria bacterium]|nr:MAG: glycosyltransferase, exosortase A system-associated [Alphaproteobacteria bacterium]
MKILHVLDHSLPVFSGYVFRTNYILKEQRKLGWQTVHVTSPKHPDPQASEETHDGKMFYRTFPNLLIKLPMIGEWFLMRALYHRLCQVIEKEKPDVLQAHSPALNGMAAVWAAKKYNLPLLYEQRGLWEDAAVSHGTTTEGGLKYKLSRFLEMHVMAKADAITCICEGLRTDLVARGVPPEKITLIPNAVDVSTFQKTTSVNEELRSRLGLEGAVTLGFIGSFYNYEGLEILLESLLVIRKEVPNVKLLLVGGGPEDENLKATARLLGIQDHVIFTGHVPHHKVQDYYNQVDIFVYPRKKMRLTDLVTPLKPLEAMAQHKLVVASDIGGHNELIENGKTGTLFTPDNSLALARTIIDLLKNRESWPYMIAEGRKYVEEVRNWKNSIANYSAVFDRIIKED